MEIGPITGLCGRDCTVNVLHSLGPTRIGNRFSTWTNKRAVRGVTGYFDIPGKGWILALGRSQCWVHWGDMDCTPRNRCIFMDRAFADWGCVLLCLRRRQFAQL